ncbi:MAG TPA: hypothetical protein VGO47_04130 [Chlamydiales bacterium]|nr:hypothetical protein [Chlamydiales bacterium]
MQVHFPRDGRGFTGTFKQLGAKVNRHYNVIPSFCYFVDHFLADILRRYYITDTLHLSDISVYNGIVCNLNNIQKHEKQEET